VYTCENIFVIPQRNIKFENESAKKVIIANRTGEIPLSKENVPKKRNIKVTTKIPPRKPTIRERSDMRENPIISIFGGVRSSSALRLFSSRF
jgi:hypothetical protein